MRPVRQKEVVRSKPTVTLGRIPNGAGTMVLRVVFLFLYLVRSQEALLGGPLLAAFRE